MSHESWWLSFDSSGIAVEAPPSDLAIGTTKLAPIWNVKPRSSQSTEEDELPCCKTCAESSPGMLHEKSIFEIWETGWVIPVLEEPRWGRRANFTSVESP